MTTRTSVRWSRIVPAVALTTVVIVVCGALGWWQWTRASEQGEVRQPDPAVPIAELVAPAEGFGGAVGRAVEVAGEYADAEAALIPDREVDGEPAVLVVRPFTVAADATGTGAPATLPVLVGWLAPDEVTDLGEVPSASAVVGALRSAEGAAPTPPPAESPPPGAFWASGLSPAVFAQHWESPLYSGLVAADEPEPGLRALPQPEESRSLDFRSLAYAFEWWLFGAFAVVLAVRWMRDNGRTSPEEEPADD